MVIVKALCDLKKNNEIFNCYGADYRYMKKKERREHLNSLYHFLCFCEICSDPNLEIVSKNFSNKTNSFVFKLQDVLNNYVCSYCEGPVDKTRLHSGICLYCKKKIDLENHIPNKFKIDEMFVLCKHFFNQFVLLDTI